MQIVSSHIGGKDYMICKEDTQKESYRLSIMGLNVLHSGPGPTSVEKPSLLKGPSLNKTTNALCVEAPINGRVRY